MAILRCRVVYSLVALIGLVGMQAFGQEPVVRLTGQAEVRVGPLRLGRGGSVAVARDNGRICLVGTSNIEARTADVPAAGFFVDFNSKKTEPFTNEHSGEIHCVSYSFDDRLIVTGGSAELGSKSDGKLRVWDLAARRSLEPIDLPDLPIQPRLACSRRSSRVAVALDDRIAVLDLAGKEKRLDLVVDQAADAVPGNPTFSRDDKYLAYENVKGQVVIWEMETRKVVFSTCLLPNGADWHDWCIASMCFTKSGELLVAREGFRDDHHEVPPGTPEDKVPAERRGLFLIDPVKHKATPLGLGCTQNSLHAALDPSDQWLAVVGHSWPDKPTGKIDDTMSELRIYHFASRRLVHRVQFDSNEFIPSWVGFTPNGKKLIAVSVTGVVRSWDFTGSVPTPTR
jgi:WD40 repeat protein